MIKLKDISKIYVMGDAEVRALDGISLEIAPGDFVAIMGPSGSGKSTLMHVIGLLDTPTSGSYQIQGQEVSHLTEDALADIRSRVLGFIFQQFNLLARMSATDNVVLPLLYSGRLSEAHRGRELLNGVGLGERAFHHPNALSGGQQQRVAIARSLINRPRIILADEPTGNLDSKSEKEILEILEKLNQDGITIVMVTHEEEVGQKAKRLIRMRDGKIQSDERLRPLSAAIPVEVSYPTPTPRDHWRDTGEYARQGIRTLLANKVRTILSMLGILIGVAAVVAMLAIGRGAQKDIEQRLSSLGSNLLVLRMGAVRKSGVSKESGTVARMTTEDIEALMEKVPSLKRAAASVNGRVQAAFGNRNWSTQVQGTVPDFQEIRASVPAVGRFFTDEENRLRSRVAVIGTTVQKELFGDRNPIGEQIKLNKVVFQVIGILPTKGSGGFRDQDDNIIIPLSTAMHRLLGKNFIDSADLEITRPELMDEAEEQILEVLYSRHHVGLSQRQGAFDIRNMADIQEALSESSRTMAILLASIAAISLLVGGIGIMNIMLVSVTERTKEIGLRKAVGARRADILTQFLAESVVVTVIGGILGILFGASITFMIGWFTGWSTAISPGAVMLAFFFSMFIGVVFGLYPAQKASRLHPIQALRYE